MQKTILTAIKLMIWETKSSLIQSIGPWDQNRTMDEPYPGNKERSKGMGSLQNPLPSPKI